MLGIATLATSGAVATMGGEMLLFGRSAIFAARGQSALLFEAGNPLTLIRYGYTGSRGLFQIRPTGSSPIVRLDFHAITEGGRRLLHLDFNRWGIQHWPW